MDKGKQIRRGLLLQYIVAALALVIIVLDTVDAVRLGHWDTRTIFHLAVFSLVFLLAVVEIIRLGRRKGQ